MLVITGSLADIAGSATEVVDDFISIQTLHLFTFIKCSKKILWYHNLLIGVCYERLDDVLLSGINNYGSK